MQRFTTLLYHEVREEATGSLPIDVADRYADRLPEALYVTAAELEHHLQWLSAEGYRGLTLASVLEFYESGAPLPEKAVQITFDDMYQSSLHLACPLLRKYGFPAAGFVVGDWIFDTPQPIAGRMSRTLSWPELEVMSDVFEWAHHSGALHRRDAAGSLFVQSSAETVAADLHRGRRRLTHPDVFAYPFGLYDTTSIGILRSAGIRLAYTTVRGTNTASTSRWELRRNVVTPGTDMQSLMSVLD